MLQYVEIRHCFNFYLNWFSVLLFYMCSGVEFQNEGPEYVIVNILVFVLASCNHCCS